MAIEKPILIYANMPLKKYRLLAYMAVTQISFLGINLVLIPPKKRSYKFGSFDQLNDPQVNTTTTDESNYSHEQPIVSELTSEWPPEKSSSNDSILSRIMKLDYKSIVSPANIIENIMDRPIVTGCVLLGSTVVCSAMMMIPRRSIHKIVLLPGDRARLYFFSPFGYGKPPSVEMSLRDISCSSGRSASGDNCILKLRGYLGAHLVDKKPDNFIEPRLYDDHLSFRRSWAK